LGVAAVAAWLSVMAGAFITALELGFSGTSPVTVVLPAMLGVHALIGIGEALITVAALAFITQTRPDLLEAGQVRARGGQGWAITGLIIAVAFVVLSPWASGNPDGLNRVAEDLGFVGLEAGTPFEILSGYTIPFLGDTAVSTILAGAVGALIVAALAAGAGFLLRRQAVQPVPKTGQPVSR
jgi:cobalt/nickel transport system permease protein